MTSLTQPFGAPVLAPLRAKSGWIVALGVIYVIAGLIALGSVAMATVVSVFIVGIMMLIAADKFQRDPHWRDNLLFYEYFHGDNGAGIGASHQTGWTGVVAGLIDIFGKLDAETFLQGGRGAVFGREIETA